MLNSSSTILTTQSRCTHDMHHMHPTLSIQEILHNVCAYACDSTRLSLIRTCQALHAVAIQSFWSDLPDLTPLIKCLPEDAWAVDKRSGLLRIVRSLSPEDWNSFLKYSVHEISMHWGLEDDPEQHLQTCMSVISNRFSSLEDFQLYCKNRLLVCRLIPESFTEQLRNLRMFRTYKLPISKYALRSLGRLQNLTVVAIYLPAFLSPELLGPESFPALCEIRITALTTLTRAYFAFANAVAMLPQVKVAHIDLRDVPKPEEGLRLFDLVCTQFSCTRLVELFICSNEDACSRRRRPPALTVNHPHLRRLLCFAALTELNVNLACSYALDGDLCLEIAKAFPEIQSLHIGDYDWCYYEYPSIIVPPMTHVLAPFATHCPHLTSLGIPFDARESLSLQDVKDALPDRPSRSQVWHLNCSHCPIEDDQTIAAYLARVFPMLEGRHDLEWSDFGADMPSLRWKDKWYEVRRLLPWFKVIRDDEAATTEEPED
ncbi:hypothetical protein BD310DRAFT_1038776 [Dichomitus squalens]|uniref:F-box domain-containing protein n=1 Tax=Dichomitus squalens TaxID=114155 RepID=A0A4Q9PWH6_9APHY|nr:hypothetical protein BD310DRAFT_1038776 [Dichomitus squalens]